MKLLHETTQQLSAVYPSGEASALARWVMEEKFGLTLTDIMMDKDNDLSSVERQELQNITERLLRKEPIQYILGQTRFGELTLHVGPGALIPRPETLELVEWIYQCHTPTSRPALQVLDIGTGSGCIALSLAHRGFAVEAWDISEEALRIARSNAERLHLDVRFKKEDILQIAKLEETTIPGTTATTDTSNAPLSFDIIVSNPPYICEQEAEEMETNVLDHEPHLALFVPNDDPLLFYRHIARFASRHLRPGGQLFFEINRAYGIETCQMLSDMGFTDITLRNDQFDNPRMIQATLYSEPHPQPSTARL